jgi:hypothetical protein
MRLGAHVRQAALVAAGIGVLIGLAGLFLPPLPFLLVERLEALVGVGRGEGERLQGCAGEQQGGDAEVQGGHPVKAETGW